MDIRSWTAHLFITLSLLLTTLESYAFPEVHANHVSIRRTPDLKRFVITIHYTLIQVGEYRRAQVVFQSEQRALKYFHYIKNGGALFLGDLKKLPLEKPHPEAWDPF